MSDSDSDLSSSAIIDEEGITPKPKSSRSLRLRKEEKDMIEFFNDDDAKQIIESFAALRIKFMKERRNDPETHVHCKFCDVNVSKHTFAKHKQTKKHQSAVKNYEKLKRKLKAKYDN